MLSRGIKILRSPAAAVVLAALWAMELRNTEANYSVYLVCAILAACSAASLEIKASTRRPLRLGAAIIALCVTAANSDMYKLLPQAEELLRLVLLFALSYAVLLRVSALVWQLLSTDYPKERALRPAPIFALSFLTILAAYLSYFALAAYPGNLTQDSINQLTQIMTGSYSNHHPYYHTMIIKLLYSLGMTLFNDVNKAVATYTVFQITVMAAIFAFSVSTLSRLRVRRVVLVAALAIYVFLPQHWIYASTMWKDVLFGGMCLLLVTALARYRSGLGSRRASMALFALASVGVCLLRSNGIFAYIFFAAALILRRKKNGKALVAVAIAALAVSSVLKGPVLKALNVPQPDIVESLSIPLQQLAGVVREGGELGEHEEYIYSIIDAEKADACRTYNADDIKELCRSMGANEIIGADLTLFIKAWVEIGIKNPIQYGRSWIAQTCGYYNAGYSYWFALPRVVDNELGINARATDGLINRAVWGLVDAMASAESGLPSMLVATGALTWLYIILTVHGIAVKGCSAESCFLALGIVLSLLIATPVANELRYAYGLYTMFPFLAAAVPAENKPEQQEKNR